MLPLDSAVDPRFWNWNIAYAKYCDGGSFSGNRSEPVDANGTLLYFRGARILKAIVANVTAHVCNGMATTSKPNHSLKHVANPSGSARK